ncbi:5-formyltetrahydrofolate cyclo-ligase [Methanoregula sp.]|jgi:5-formyltetrahydrofolate cyclo-ligase|uniref:5-formyltetrahydrofolate cyclo-ligase n=1 Tax=Methanoregula sp. TaxID=2052170 RepID=UPI003C78B61B
MAKTKQEIRTEVKQRRLALTPQERKEKSRCICAALLSLLDGTGPVMVYVAKPPEVDTELLITTLLARGTRVIVPVIERKTTTLRLSYLEDPSVLVESTFCVPEPVGCEIPARPDEIGIAIIPLLAFDRQGNRLGYGAGYYDRFLAAHPRVKTIGIAFACQEMPELPGEPTDIRMDRILTESGLIPVLENKDHEH